METDILLIVLAFITYVFSIVGAVMYVTNKPNAANFVVLCWFVVWVSMVQAYDSLPSKYMLIPFIYVCIGFLFAFFELFRLTFRNPNWKRIKIKKSVILNWLFILLTRVATYA